MFNCAPFINCICELNNAQVDDAHVIDVVMPMYNLIEYSDTCLKTPGSLWQYYGDASALTENGKIIDFPKDNSYSH